MVLTSELNHPGESHGALQNPYAFHGGIKDPGSGLVKFGLRCKYPITGTWTQQDTLPTLGTSAIAGATAAVALGVAIGFEVGVTGVAARECFG